MLGTINIHGGHITTTGGAWSAGIGGGVGGGGGTINIYGGTLSSTATHPGYGIQQAIGCGSSGANVTRSIVDGLRVYCNNNSTPTSYNDRISGIGQQIAVVEPCIEHNFVGKETTIPADEYSLDYSNNVNVGTATVTVSDNADGNYTVSGSATFIIDTTFTLNIAAGVWQAISTPAHDAGQTYESISNVTRLTTGDYDMFRYNEPTATWENQKAGSEAAGFDVMEPARGFIYRRDNSELGNSNFEIQNSQLIYNGQPNSEPAYSHVLTANGSSDLKGFNLVGNPYPFKVLLDRAFYSLNADGTWTAHPDGDSLEVGQGALVYTKDGETLTFYASTRSTNAGSKGPLPPLPKSLCLSTDCEDDGVNGTNGHFAHQQGDCIVITSTGLLQVYDLLGRQLFRRNVNSQLSILNSQFPSSGVYILRLGEKTQKIVIR